MNNITLYVGPSTTISCDFPMLNKLTKETKCMKTFGEVMSYLTSDNCNQHPDLILIDIKSFAPGKFSHSDRINMISAASSTKDNTHNTVIAVIADHTDNPILLKELKQCGIKGFVPNPKMYDISLTENALSELLAGKTFWPKSILPAIKKTNTPKKISDSIKLTDRQTQVLKLVCRGLSNKAIGNQLNITESTVKVHVSEILKQYGARNRTQLALFASQNNQPKK